ncbi:hypothetical protein Tco_0436087 [Tanacetum coccineum]
MISSSQQLLVEERETNAPGRHEGQGLEPAYRLYMLESQANQAQKTPPKKRTATTITTTTPMTDAQLKALIAQGVADALVEIEANKTSINGDDSHDFGTHSRRTERAARECTYSDFLQCQPLNFKGTKRVVGLAQWL